MTRIEEQVAQLDKLTVGSLTEKLNEIECSVSGAKAVLKERLRKALMGDGKTWRARRERLTMTKVERKSTWGMTKKAWT